ncbi:MAG TPA: serine/threonine-protein kinase [Gemmatimonadales bacterium]|nr:serine/threonine-protein kinase [Gemmatimonadales bacterium]
MNDADRALTSRLTQALGSSYTVEGEIGRGGMGVVFNARDERLKRQVAVKVLPPELAFREEIRIRFLREAETAARLSHPHIVPIYSVGDAPDGLVYFVMAFVDGEPLSARLKRRGRLPAEEARRITSETADALSAAHAVGIIHRDVKPDNILLEGSRGRVVVTDFGIAKALSSTTGGATLTATGAAIGTPHYMSPEQAAGEREVDGRSDIYSLGVVAYQMLAGSLPFHAPTVPGVLMKQITERAPLITDKRPDCPEDLAAAVMRCLEKDPDDRWPTADALRRALEARTATFQRARTSGPSAARAAVPRAPDRPAPAKPEPIDTGGEPAIVRRTRAGFVRWVSVSAPLVLLDTLTGNHIPSWSLLVSGLWGLRLVPRYVSLWQAGYSWRDLLARPPASDALSAGGVAAVGRAAAAAEFGSHEGIVQQARGDRQAILKIVEKLPASERRLLPDVTATVDTLMRRAEELGRMLHSISTEVDTGAVRRLEAKIADTEREPPSTERDRQLGLLSRQRHALGALLDRRQVVEAQLESCGLAMQNVRFDLLRLKSAGVAAALGDLTHATEEARALSRDVDNAIAAAGEIRETLGGPAS